MRQKALVVPTTGPAWTIDWVNGDHFGFAGYAYSPWRREIAALSSGQAHQDNIIFVRQPELVRDRLKSAPSIAVHGKQL